MAMNKDYAQRGPPDDEIYEEVNTFESPEPGHYSQYGNTNESSSASSYAVSNSAQISDESQNYHTASESEESGIRHQSSSYENNYHGLDPAEKQNKVYDSVERKDENEIWIKTRQFKSSPKEFIASFKNSKNEMRTDEETFIIVHLLGRSSTKSPVLDGRLDHLAMLACCDSPHVVKRALDILLNEIFLSISDSCTVRCYKILEAEEILRVSLPGFLKLDHFKAKCHRMTTYAWLITFVFLKCNVKHFTKIQAEMKQFDKLLHALQDDRKNNERNIFRYGIYLARESIKQIIHSCGKKDFSETLRWNIKKCETLLHGKLEGTEVLQLGRDLRDGVSWIDLHVCLVFLQDLPKFYNFHEDKKPVILIQMLVADYRKRSATMKYRSFLKQQTFEWLFEILVYHVMLRLIRTSPSKAITEQVLGGQHGCGGILVQPLQSKSKKSEQVFGMHLKKLCQRAIFVAKPDFVSQFIEDNSSGDEEQFIEQLSILHLSSSYRDKIFEILQESRVRSEQHSVVTYDCQLSGRKCLLKLNYHSKEDLLGSNALKTVALRTEIQILKVLNSDEEATRHIVQLFGSSIEAPIHMIIERTPKNDLLSYLQDISNPPQARALFKISLDICTAMVYLGKHAVIHRDLRAKNCIIFFRAGGDLVAKLGDFHLAVISYPASNLQESSNRRTSAVRETALKQFALRWMAIEVLQLCEFSPASDVWSFGILLSEIFTFGCKPYTNMRSGLSLEREEEVQAFILNGKRLELHPKIPEKIRLLIEYTMRDVDHRPTFSYLKDNLMNIMENRTGGELYDEPTVFWMSQKDQSYARGKETNQRGGCSVDGCNGDCAIASDTAHRMKVEYRGNLVDGIQEFVSGTPDILLLSEHTITTLAAFYRASFHLDKVELVTEGGDFSLVDYIKKNGCLDERAMMYISNIGVAMSYLHEKDLIHRNVRASSVFISNKKAKLGCFARVKRLQSYPSTQSSLVSISLPMPSDDSFRWSSPEVISDGKYSKASDVWAFAVLIWELFTLIDFSKDDDFRDKLDDKAAFLPYDNLSSKEQMLSHLEKKNRLGQPLNCPEWLYSTMGDCWQYDADDRPKCENILQTMNDEAYYDVSGECAERATQLQADKGEHTPPPTSTGPLLPNRNQPIYFRAVYNFSLPQMGQISLIKDDIISAITTEGGMDGGDWIKGRNLRSKEVGWIPLNHLEKLPLPV